MARMVTVWCPDWPVVAAGVAADVPAVVLHANRVVARSPAAAAEGVVIGQRRRQAQQLCPDVALLDHDPDRDARAFEPVVRAIGRFAPRLEVVEPGWLCLGARGPSRYFGGDERLAAQLIDAVGAEAAPPAVGVGRQPAIVSVGRQPAIVSVGRQPAIVSVGRQPAIVSVGIADGRFAAAVAARRAGRRAIVVAPGATPDFLAPLPVAWLQHVGEVDPELVGLFARMGLARLGDLAALPGGDVLARFGPPGRRAHRLAGGVDDRPPGGTEPPPERRVEQTFDDAVVQLEPLVFVAKHLADQLVAALAAEGRVCTRLVVTAETEHGERTERAWYRAAGLSVPAMVERVRWQLDGWMSSGELSAGVVLLRLAPDEVRGDDGEQVRLWGGPSAADERAARTISRLAGIVGDQGVLVPAWRGGRLPGDRYGWVPASTTDLTDADDTAERLRPSPLEGGNSGAGGGVPGRAGPWPGALPAPSPAIVPAEVQRAELLDAAGVAVAVSGRGELSAAPALLAAAGRPPLDIVGWAGPWPLDERWWEPSLHRRLARLQIVTADGAAHLVLAEHRTWWIAATYG
jgi:protein ImuB